MITPWILIAITVACLMAVLLGLAVAIGAMVGGRPLLGWAFVALTLRLVGRRDMIPPPPPYDS